MTFEAKLIGMALANLSNLKTGKPRAISFSTLGAICEALSCQPTFFGLSLSKQNANDRQRRANGAQADERSAECGCMHVARSTHKSNKDDIK